LSADYTGAAVTLGDGTLSTRQGARPCEIGLRRLTHEGLPAVSVLSGRPADATLRTTFSVRGLVWTPSHIAFVILLITTPTVGALLDKASVSWLLWPLIAVDGFLGVNALLKVRRASVTVEMPVSSAELAQRRRLRVAAAVSAVVSVASLVAAGAMATSTARDSLEALGTALFGITAVSCIVGLALIGGQPAVRGVLRKTADGNDAVVLKAAHPEFVRALGLTPRACQPPADGSDNP
jgi:hypothetical protein